MDIIIIIISSRLLFGPRQLACIRRVYIEYSKQQLIKGINDSVVLWVYVHGQRVGDSHECNCDYIWGIQIDNHYVINLQY